MQVENVPSVPFDATVTAGFASDLHNTQVGSNLQNMQVKPTPREQATEALQVDVAEWIDRQRNGPARLTYSQIAQVLAAETGVKVSREALRQWHATLGNTAA
jgi:transposase